MMKKGFTLIELLVVIAVLGILASVVLVAINPAQRIAEANDTGVRSSVGQVGTAIEACYTTNGGSYANCDTLAELSSAGFMKTSPTGVTLASTAVTFADVVAYGTLAAQSATCPGGQSGTKYFAYHTSTGTAGIECHTSPTVPTP